VRKKNITIKGEDTVLVFHILDFIKDKQNLFQEIKIKEQEIELASLQLKNEKNEFNLKVKKDQKMLILNLELFNDKTILKYEIDIIIKQKNYFYLFINKINDNIIDFMYKNYTEEKQTFKQIKIMYEEEKKEYQLDFNFIDKQQKIARIILLNFNHDFKIGLDNLPYCLYKSKNTKWLYCLKQYNNDLLLSCHLKSIYPEPIDKNIKEEANKFIDDYKILLFQIINNKDNKIKKFMIIGKLIEKNKDIMKMYLKYLAMPIDKIENYSKENFFNLYNFLCVKIIILFFRKHNKNIIEENEKEKSKQRNDNTKNIVTNFFDEIDNSLNNLYYSFNYLNESSSITSSEGGKKLSIIASLLIEDPLGQYNTDTLREINLAELSKKNINNYYVKATQIFKDIIIHLSSESLMAQCGLELNSKNTENFNLSIEDEYSQEINIITIDELKLNLLKTIPNKFFVVYHKSNNYSYFETISQNIVMNEQNIFKEMNEDEIKIIFKNEDKNGNYTLCILTLLFHESLGHATIRIEDPELFSPLKFNYKGFLISLIDDDNNNSYQEAGKITEQFLTNFNLKNQFFLLNSGNKDVNCLLDYKLYVDDLKKLNQLINTINDDKTNITITDFKEYLKKYEELNEKINFNLKEDDLLNNIKKYFSFNSDCEEELIKREPKKII
jgi:hypothetical protein